MGMSLGALASGYILTFTGFDVKLEGHQTEHALFMIRFLLALIPVIGLVIALLALLRFGLSRDKMAEIRTTLEARRGTV
jgi:GPH family glycoside/pentoside/hexuronide:cation symporter